MTWRIVFGLNVKGYRKRLRMTQEQLGHLVGISRTHISRIERASANVSFNHIIRVAYGLGVDPPYLFVRGAWLDAAGLQQRDLTMGSSTDYYFTDL